MRRYFYSLIQKVIEHTYGIRKKDSKVFMFHQVSDDKRTWSDAGCSITCKMFKDFIRGLIKLNICFGSLDELVANGKKVYITFDDVYSDAVENAIPFLIENNIPFCIFISTDLIGKDKYISMEQLKAMAIEPLCTIGFHTRSHVFMRKMKKDSLPCEMDKQYLEKTLKRTLYYFAYPYGSLYAIPLRYIKKITMYNYKFAFSTIGISFNCRMAKMFSAFLPRINVNEKNATIILNKA